MKKQRVTKTQEIRIKRDEYIETNGIHTRTQEMDLKVVEDKDLPVESRTLIIKNNLMNAHKLVWKKSKKYMVSRVSTKTKIVAAFLLIAMIAVAIVLLVVYL